MASFVAVVVGIPIVVSEAVVVEVVGAVASVVVSVDSGASTLTSALGRRLPSFVHRCFW